MNNNFILEDPPTSDYAPDVTQYLTFKVAGYLLALPSQEILRVVAMPPPNEGGLVQMGLVQLAHHSIQIIDLAQLLELNAASNTALASNGLATATKRLTSAAPAQNPPFLMVLQNADRDLWGIAVHEPPDLMEIPNYALKFIPPKQRKTRALRWVSHIVTYDLASRRRSLPILDLSELIGPQ